MTQSGLGPGLVGAGAADDAELAALGYRSAVDLVTDRRGVEVRRLPRGSTWRFEVGGRAYYRKVRTRDPGQVHDEWQTLQRLRAAGLPVPEPVVFAGQTGEGGSGFVMREVPGRSIDRLLVEAESDPLTRRQLVERIAGLVGRMHALGCYHRDLYLGHWLSPSLEPDAPLHLIDVERAVWPRWWRWRWLVKDLAALWSSWPLQPSPRLALRFLRSAGTPPSRRLLRAVERKAARIRAHRPRHDGEPPAPPGGGG